MGLSLVGMGLLGGVLAAQVWFDQQRAGGVTKGEEAGPVRPFALITRNAGSLTTVESSNSPWAIHIQRMDDALARKDVGGAEMEWHSAYVEAISSRGWEGLIEVGNAYLRTGELAKGRLPAEAEARRLYLAGLFRARNQDSLGGVLQATEAFAALGDREVAAHGIRIAEDLAERQDTPGAGTQVRAFAARLSFSRSEGNTAAPGPFPF
jgi:hypothetical protein